MMAGTMEKMDDSPLLQHPSVVDEFGLFLFVKDCYFVIKNVF